MFKFDSFLLHLKINIKGLPREILKNIEPFFQNIEIYPVIGWFSNDRVQQLS